MKPKFAITVLLRNKDGGRLRTKLEVLNTMNDRDVMRKKQNDRRLKATTTPGGGNSNNRKGELVELFQSRND